MVTKTMRDQVLALKAAENARDHPETSPLGAAEAAARFVQDCEGSGTLYEAWSEYVKKYPSLGGL